MIGALDVLPARATRLSRAADLLAWPVAVLALLVVPAPVPDGKAAGPRRGEAACIADWVVWIGFVAEFAIRWAADGRARFLRDAWFGLLLIVISPPFLVPGALQGTRSLRMVRALRLLRLIRAGAVATIGLRLSRHLFGRRKFHYTALVAVAVVFLGAL